MPYNPYLYNTYPMSSYTPYTPQAPMVGQSGVGFAAPQPQSGIIWVDGEVGAIAFQLPAGWPANMPMPLWDTREKIIYLKSNDAAGRPNQLQRLPYSIEEPASQTSGNSYRSANPALPSGEEHTETKNYATKEDLDRMRDELRESITEAMATQATTKKGGKANEPTV